MSLKLPTLIILITKRLTLWSVVGDDGHRLPGVLQGGGGLFVSGVPEVHPVDLKTAAHRQRAAKNTPNYIRKQ